MMTNPLNVLPAPRPVWSRPDRERVADVQLLREARGQDPLSFTVAERKPVVDSETIDAIRRFYGSKA